jgi:hypothetical protein
LLQSLPSDWHALGVVCGGRGWVLLGSNGRSGIAGVMPQRLSLSEKAAEPAGVRVSVALR